VGDDTVDHGDVSPGGSAKADRVPTEANVRDEYRRRLAGATRWSSGSDPIRRTTWRRPIPNVDAVSTIERTRTRTPGQEPRRKNLQTPYMSEGFQGVGSTFELPATGAHLHR